VRVLAREVELRTSFAVKLGGTCAGGGAEEGTSSDTADFTEAVIAAVLGAAVTVGVGANMLALVAVAGAASRRDGADVGVSGSTGARRP